MRRIAARVDLDAATREIPATASRRLAEDLEWTALGRDEGEADAREAALGKLGRRAESELVECNRPDDAARNGDDEAAGASGLSLVEEPAGAFGVDVTRNVNAPSSAVVGLAPHATKMDVVLDVEPLARASDSGARIDGGQLARCEPRAGDAPSSASSNTWTRPALNGSATASGRYQKWCSGARSSSSTRSSAKARRASIVSSGHAAGGDQNSKRVCPA
jgi:hypothetical protein